MNVRIDSKYVQTLERLAASSGLSLDEIVQEVFEEGLKTLDTRKFEFDAVHWKSKLVRFLDEMSAMPAESPDDGFSGTDHDDVLYPREP